MTSRKRKHIQKLVKIICGSTIEYDIPTNDTISTAYELLRLVGVTGSAEIEEIPLCWDNQVCIRFSIGKSDIETNPLLFDLSAGISNIDPKRFFLDLQVENECHTFPVAPDDDVGIYLFQDEWMV